MSSYLIGADVLGAGGFGDAAAEQFLVVRVNNVADLVSKKGGRAGGLVFSALPTTITNQVYSEMQKKLAAGLRDEGVDATVTVTSTPPKGGGKLSNDALTGAAIGGLAVGAAWLIKTFLKRSR